MLSAPHSAPTGPASDPGPSRQRLASRGVQPAGQVLAVMVATLGLAALINADALVQRAEDKPLGSGRDRSLMIWHPVQDVAHATQLYRLRSLGDAVAGNEARGGTGEVIEAVAPPPPEAKLVAPTLRTPTVEEPLRVFIGGDSIVRDAGDAFLQIAAGSPILEPSLHYENATGLTRPDAYDWPAALAEDMATHEPDVAIILFGGNDSQGIQTPSGEVFQTVREPGWQAEYSRRVGGVMDLLRAEGRVVFWIGLPPMREAGFDARVDILNRIYAEAATTRPWVTFVDTFPLFGDSEGNYVATADDPDGTNLRQADGIHLSAPGATVLARELFGRIDAKLRSSEETGDLASTTTSPTVVGDVRG